MWFEWHTTRFTDILCASRLTQKLLVCVFMYETSLDIMYSWLKCKHVSTHMDHIAILMGRWNCVTEISEPFRCDTIRHSVDVLAFFHAQACTHTETSFKIMSLLAFTLRLMRDQLNANIIIFFMCAWQQYHKKNETGGKNRQRASARELESVLLRFNVPKQ